ncbi:MarR family winged helix-turn-helix transcriptional regulator [Periweissella cryptocerci]|nr:winged helix DNA-binding protein [Periweissella cryptocerci]
MQNELVITDVLENFYALEKRLQAEQDDEQKWLQAQIHDATLGDVFEQLSTLKLHVLAAIGQLQPANGTLIAQTTAIPKGTVSKTTKSLIALGLVVAESMPNNKKEVLFALTAKGIAIDTQHAALHRRIEQNLTMYLQSFDDNELQLINHFLRQVATRSWLDTEAAVPDLSAKDQIAQQVHQKINQLNATDLNKVAGLLEILF